jgi:TRAP-type C4-dicarboxylate transport system permease small subunit
MSTAPQMAERGALEDAIDNVCDAIAVIGFTGLVFIAFLALADVVLRYGNLPRLPGFKDLTEVAYAVVIASCFPAGLKKGNAVTVRLLGKVLGDRGHAWLDVVGAAVVFALFALFAWQFMDVTARFQSAGRTTSTLEWPTAPVWWVVSGMMAVCAVVQGWIVAANLAAALKGVPRPAHDEHILE